MSLLSKEEIQYLEGHKQLSKSYERKIKCTIRKKIQGLKREIPLLTRLIPIEQIFDFENLVIVKRSNIDQEPATEISNPPASEIGATKNSKTTNNSNIANLSTIPYNHENSTILNHNKLYNCQQDIHQKKNRRVRSVVRISRRSSEPQVMGSKPTGPV
jgi:hypothetical protein